MSKIILKHIDSKTINLEPNICSNNMKTNALVEVNDEVLKQVYGGGCSDHTPEELAFIVAYANEPVSRELQGAICRGHNTGITAIEFGSGATNNTATVQFK